MKIDSFVPSLPPENSGQANQVTNSNSSAHRSAIQSQPDVADLSGTADRLSLLSTQALSAPEVRTQRVAELQAAVSEGRYQVSSQRIAAALFDQLRIHA